MKERNCLQSIKCKFWICICWTCEISSISLIAVKRVWYHIDSPWIGKLRVKRVISHMLIEVMVQVIRLVLGPERCLPLELNRIDIHPHSRPRPKENRRCRLPSTSQHTQHIPRPASSQRCHWSYSFSLTFILLSAVCRSTWAVLRAVRWVLIELIPWLASQALRRIRWVNRWAIWRCSSSCCISRCRASRPTQRIPRSTRSAFWRVARCRGDGSVRAGLAVRCTGDSRALSALSLSTVISILWVTLSTKQGIHVIQVLTVSNRSRARCSSKIRGESWSASCALNRTCSRIVSARLAIGNSATG